MWGGRASFSTGSSTPSKLVASDRKFDFCFVLGGDAVRLSFFNVEGYFDFSIYQFGECWMKQLISGPAM